VRASHAPVRSGWRNRRSKTEQIPFATFSAHAVCLGDLAFSPSNLDLSFACSFILRFQHLLCSINNDCANFLVKYTPSLSHSIDKQILGSVYLLVNSKITHLAHAAQSSVFVAGIPVRPSKNAVAHSQETH